MWSLGIELRTSERAACAGNLSHLSSTSLRFLFMVCACLRAPASHGTYVELSKELVGVCSLSILWVPGIELGLSGLAASAFTRCAISPDLYGPCLGWLQNGGLGVEGLGGSGEEQVKRLGVHSFSKGRGLRCPAA